jgi:hypothetical protein
MHPLPHLDSRHPALPPDAPPHHRPTWPLLLCPAQPFSPQRDPMFFSPTRHGLHHLARPELHLWRVFNNGNGVRPGRRVAQRARVGATQEVGQLAVTVRGVVRRRPKRQRKSGRAAPPCSTPRSTCCSIAPPLIADWFLFLHPIDRRLWCCCRRWWIRDIFTLIWLTVDPSN